jgi:hypothetical protein
VKRPSDAELALAKPVKTTRKFALAPSTGQASGSGVAGGSTSRAPAAPEGKALAADASARVRLISVLEMTWSESREGSPHGPPPPLSTNAGALRLSFDLGFGSAIAVDAGASQLQVLVATG